MTTAEMQERYGRRRGLSPRVRTAAIVVALLLATLAMYGVFRAGQRPIQSANGDFQVTSASQVLVSYEVHKPKAWTVTCVIRARGGSGLEVGRATITLQPGRSVVRDHYPLPTTETAVTGEIQDCARAAGNR